MGLKKTTEQFVSELKEMKGFHYTPKIPFGGHVRECFSKEGIEQATTMFKNLQEI